MSMGREPIWIVADAADARRLLAEPSRKGRVLGLTPVARAALADAAPNQIDPRSRFTDWAQARTVAAVRRARRKLVAAAAALPGARPIQREIALDLFLRAAYTGYRLWFTLGATGPWMVPAGGGWLRCETRDEAYRALLGHMLAPLVAGQAAALRAHSPPLPGLYRLLRRILLGTACRGRVAFVSGARKGMFGLLDAIAALKSPTRIVIVQAMGGGWRDYLRLARNAWRTLRGARFVDVALLGAPTGDRRAEAERLIAAVDDGVIQAAFGFYRALLACRLAQVAPALADARDIAAAARPLHYLSPDASRLSDLALAEVCGERGTTRWVMSRNTHVPPHSRLAEEGCRGYLLERQPPGLVDRYLFWSPHGAAAARHFLPRENWGAVEPIRAVPVIPSQKVATARTERRVLATDSFAAFWYVHYWIYQTSDEFLAAHIALARVIEQIPDAYLTIRLKAKLELDPAAYQRLLPMSERVRVKSRSAPIVGDILDSDVVVAFRSTTIEEALHARRPVLLWGVSERYRYLPAQTRRPRPGQRSAIYSAATPNDLEVMLRAILDCHSGKALTDAEIAAHVWPPETPSVADLARRLLHEPEPSSDVSRTARHGDSSSWRERDAKQA